MPSKDPALRILLVPYDCDEASPSSQDTRSADLVLKEQESGDFVAIKWRDGNPADVATKVAQ